AIRGGTFTLAFASLRATRESGGADIFAAPSVPLCGRYRNAVDAPIDRVGARIALTDSLDQPGSERARRKIAVQIAGIPTDFLSKPLRLFESLVLAPQFQFRDDEPLVLALELVHFPGFSCVLHEIASLVDQRTAAQLKQCAGVRQRNLVFEFDSGQAFLRSF